MNQFATAHGETTKSPTHTIIWEKGSPISRVSSHLRKIGKNAFCFSKQGKIRDSVENVKYQGDLEKLKSLKIREKSGNSFKWTYQLSIFFLTDWD